MTQDQESLKEEETRIAHAVHSNELLVQVCAHGTIVIAPFPPQGCSERERGFFGKRLFLRNVDRYDKSACQNSPIHRPSSLRYLKAVLKVWEEKIANHSLLSSQLTPAPS